MELRSNQKDLQNRVVDAWERGARGVMPVLATGGGKTITMAKTAKDRCDGRGVVQAHRSELVGQLSIAWAREGIEHDITASPAVRRQIIDNHLDTLGRSFYRPDADWSVESVTTAVRREPKRGVKYVFSDESHHVLQHNQWGKALAMYPDAKWMMPTATPGRAEFHHGGGGGPVGYLAADRLLRLAGLTKKHAQPAKTAGGQRGAGGFCDCLTGLMAHSPGAPDHAASDGPGLR